MFAAALLAACGAGQSATSGRSESVRAESDVGAAPAAREPETAVLIEEAAATPSPDEAAAPEPAPSGLEAWQEIPELTIGATVRSSVGPGQISAFDLGDPNLPSACRGGCYNPQREVPASFHRLRLEAGEYTLGLERVEPGAEHCSFRVERSFRVPENNTEEGWSRALRRGLSSYTPCYRSPGPYHTVLSAREAGEYIIAIVENVRFHDYPPDAREGLCGEFTLTLRRGAQSCPSD